MAELELLPGGELRMNGQTIGSFRLNPGVADWEVHGTWEPSYGTRDVLPMKKEPSKAA